MPPPADPAPGNLGLRRYEALARFGHLVVATPGLTGALWLAVAPPVNPWLRGAIIVAALVASLWLSRWRQRRLLFPLHTLSGLLEALREGDYSMRGSSRSALGDLVFNFNALADRLHQERLRFEESTYLLGKTLASLDSAVLVFDDQARLRLLNPAAQRLLGDSRERLFGRSAGELGLAMWLDGAAVRVQAHVFPGCSGRFEVRRSALRSGGRPGHLLLVNDMSAVLRDEERKAWQRLLRVLGHEVNNSLAPIRSVTATLGGMLARDTLPEDWREDFGHGLEVVGHRAESLGRFLASYSQLARLPAPTRRPLDVASLVRELVMLERHPSVVAIEGPSASTEADRDQLAQALINLIRNAREAYEGIHEMGRIDRDAAAGGAAMHAGVRVRWRTDVTCVYVEVEDDGPGPPPSENLFVPFFTTKPDGSGIGLALARQIAEGHDGGLTLETRTDAQGALATLWLPLRSVS